MNREPHDMAILKIFAARAGIELERKRAEEALRESENRLRQLNEQLEDYSRNLEQKVAERTGEIERRRQVAERLRGMLNILNSNRSLDEILDYIVADGIWLLGTGSGAIYRLDTEQARFVVQAYRGLTPEYIENLSFPVDRSFLGLALKSREPVVVADLESALRNQDIGLDAERCKILVRDYRALLAVPLIRQGTLEETDEIYGGIALYFAEPHQFSEEDIGLAVAFADQAALAIENARLRQRVRQAAVMDERNRLARELHDSVTQSLYSLTLMAEGWRRMAETGRLERIVEPLIELGSIGQQALKEMRLLVHELRPPLLAQEGLAGALHQRLGAVEQRAGIEARLLVDDMADRADLPAHVEEGLYRIAQEALNNSLKHAEATSVTVHMQADDAGIELVISDNGKGFDPAFLRNHGGVGLNSMRERARHLGGTLTINTSPGEGTRVRAWVRTTPPPHR
jgi:two-component system nitrate/nitrite sensor histidine kinase NarX